MILWSGPIFNSWLKDWDHSTKPNCDSSLTVDTTILTEQKHYDICPSQRSFTLCTWWLARKLSDLSKKKPIHGCDEAPRGLKTALSPTRILPLGRRKQRFHLTAVIKVSLFHATFTMISQLFQKQILFLPQPSLSRAACTQPCAHVLYCSRLGRAHCERSIHSSYEFPTSFPHCSMGILVFRVVCAKMQVWNELLSPYSWE